VELKLNVIKFLKDTADRTKNWYLTENIGACRPVIKTRNFHLKRSNMENM
jgi:hypothetical protein